VNHVVQFKPPPCSPRCRVNRPYPPQAIPETSDRPSFWPRLREEVGHRVSVGAVPVLIMRQDVDPKRYLAINSKYGRNLGCWLVYRSSPRSSRRERSSIRWVKPSAFTFIDKRYRSRSTSSPSYIAPHIPLSSAVLQGPRLSMSTRQRRTSLRLGLRFGSFAAPGDVAFVYTASRDGTVRSSRETPVRDIMDVGRDVRASDPNQRGMHGADDRESTASTCLSWTATSCWVSSPSATW
jgi:hypothetical protein